jgi:formate/nitrite transporter FocA (FNT family)
METIKILAIILGVAIAGNVIGILVINWIFNAPESGNDE